MSLIRRRGLSDEIGSWKIIWILVRSWRSCTALHAVQVGALVDDGARGRRLHLDQGATGGRLAATGLAHETEGLALADLEGHAGDGLDPLAAALELDDEVLDVEDDLAALVGRRVGRELSVMRRTSPVDALGVRRRDRRGRQRRPATGRCGRLAVDQGEPAGEEVVRRPHGAQRRLGLPALVLGVGAAGGEAAAVRRVDEVRRASADGVEPGPARVGQAGDGVHQSPGVGHLGVVEERAGRAPARRRGRRT